MTRTLKALRELHGLTQTDVSKLLGISLHSYCNKENGKLKFTLNEAKQLSDLFKLSIEEIFFANIEFKLNTNVV
ncbi:helix-turn-helix domain-containing protein [Clostridium sporogenes]|uniref:Helix-turn-helix domain-containing protein n=1 Tax=Clostridium sporogenes TaxID=1509 RepID=A0AAE4JV38_CLOSG|nr:helix-turn-helix domain-containing protein [Clostridium sporogenes]MDS1004988.1 helix-turn-helix domain-containing protein [Clostridium sporogenes]